MKKIIYVMVLCFFSTQAAYAYEPTHADINVSYELSERILSRLQQDNWSNASYNAFHQGLKRAIGRVQSQPSYAYIMQTTQQTIADIYDKSSNTSYFKLLATFRAKHDRDMQSSYDSPTNLQKCFDHYPLVDEYARKTNKPTPLILAMRYIESSCAMANPSNNRDGLFQIVSNDYEPGPLSRAQLESQLNDFARFMDNKWAWYYGRNKTSPKELGYTTFTYEALQTFAALYNGIDLDAGFYRYPLLNGNPYYFLGNYNAEYKGKRDGLLVFFLKLSKLEAEYFGK